ncbi:MAG: hypothetical protein U1E02_04685, partial [Hydrogenophaga sp.]|nr:hypothetical protein [Hydrogenophaga sp.]
GSSVRHCSNCSGIGARTVRRWRDWLRQRGEFFAFHLRSRFANLGREPDVPALWRRVMRSMGLDVAMAWLDQDLFVP